MLGHFTWTADKPGVDWNRQLITFWGYIILTCIIFVIVQVKKAEGIPWSARLDTKYGSWTLLIIQSWQVILIHMSFS